MQLSELLLFFMTVGTYGLAIFFFMTGLTGKRRLFFSWATFTVIAGFLTHSLNLAWRWYLTGHMPGDNIYELNSLGAWCTVLVFLLLQKRYRKLQTVGIIVLAISLAMLLYGFSKPHPLGPLSDEYQSGWFYIHIISAFLGYSCYVIASSAGFLLLYRHYHCTSSQINEALPDNQLLEDINSRFVSYGFAGHAIMLASGAIWANSAWGRYWNWDPVETWSLITWLLYAFYLHAKSFLGWRGTRLAWISIAALIAIIFTFWGVSHLPDHS